MSSTLPYLDICMSESECTAQAVDHIAVKELWITTSEFTADRIARLESIQLATEAHHQGVIDPEKGIWSWFELAVLDSSSDPTPRTLPDGQPMILLSHRIEESSEEPIQQARRFTRSDKILTESWLQPGNVIGVRVCARFAGCNNATKGILTMAFSGTEDPTTDGGNQNQNQKSYNEPSVGSDGYISFLNLTAKDIKIRLTATNDTGSENFFNIPIRETGKWERAFMQLAFVFRTDSNETLTLAVQPGKLYTVGGDLAMPEPVPKATNLNVSGTISTFTMQEKTTKSFVARFEVEALGGRELVFPASSSIALPLFDAEVTMSYADEMDLSGHRAFTGIIGQGKIALRTDNDVTLVGRVTKGGPDYLLEFTGSANWTLSQVIMPPIEFDQPKAFLIPVADSGEEGGTESRLAGEDI